jgi:hypothetical protein
MFQTGQPVRYFQTWVGEGNMRTIEYLMSGEIGLLNFLASTTRIRNNAVVEEGFGVQQDYLRAESSSSVTAKRSKQRSAGHLLKLQVCGYRWLADVRADALGVNFADLEPIPGRVNIMNYLTGDGVPRTAGREDRSEIFKMALKLVTEVTPNNGGRTLTLRSVFSIVNNTSHAIHLLAKYFAPSGSRNSRSQEDEERCKIPFTVPAGEAFHVPLSLLYRSAVKSGGKYLGKRLRDDV